MDMYPRLKNVHIPCFHHYVQKGVLQENWGYDAAQGKFGE